MIKGSEKSIGSDLPGLAGDPQRKERLMRILFLAKRRYTNKDAFRESFGRVYELPRRWAETGNTASVVLFDYRGIRTEHAGGNRHSIIVLPAADPRSWHRLRRGAVSLQPDVVIASGDCMVGLAGFQLARSMTVPFVFDVYDDYASFDSNRVFMGWNSLGYLLNRADLVLYASRSLAEGHVGDRPFVLVPNGVDPELFRPMPRDVVRKDLEIDPRTKLVGYFGSMEPDRGVEDLVTAVGQLHEADSNIRLMLGGRAPRARSPFPSWVDYRGMVPHSSVPALINACDVVSVPYRRGRMMDMGASCKIAEYLLCERPLVATDTPNFTLNFPRQAAELGPAMCRPSDPADMARAIRLQLEQPHVQSSSREHTWREIADSTLVALGRTVEGSSSS